MTTSTTTQLTPIATGTPVAIPGVIGPTHGTIASIVATEIDGIDVYTVRTGAGHKNLYLDEFEILEAAAA